MAEARDQPAEEDSGSSSRRASHCSDSSPPDDSFLFETKYIVLSFLHHLSRERPDAFLTSQASLSSSSSDPRARLYAYRWKAASLPSSPPHKLRSKRVKKRGPLDHPQQSRSEENLVKKKPPRPRSAKKSKCDKCKKTQRDDKHASFAKGKVSSPRNLRPSLSRSMSRSYDDIHYLRSVSSSTDNTEYQSDADDELDTSIDSGHSFSSTFSRSKEFKMRQVSRDLTNVSHRLSTVVSESEQEADHLLMEQVNDEEEELPSDHAEPELLLGIRDLAPCLSPCLPPTHHQVLDVSSVALQFDDQLSTQAFTFPSLPAQAEDVPLGPSEDVPVIVQGLDVVTETSHPVEEMISPSSQLHTSYPPPNSTMGTRAYEPDLGQQEVAQAGSGEQLQRLHSADDAWNADLTSTPCEAPEVSTLTIDEQQDTSEYCMCETSISTSVDIPDADRDEVMSKDSLDAVDGMEDGQSEEVTGDELMDDTVDGGEVTGAAGNDLDLGDQAGAAWSGAASGDRSRLFLDLAIPPPEQLVATFQEELEDEMMTLESEIEDVLKSQHFSRSGTPQVPLTPQTEVARILASIGDEIKMEHEQRLNLAVSSLFSTSGGLLSYTGFLDSARHLVNCHLPGWRQVALLMVYSQQVAFEALRFGKQGVGDLTDYTVAMLADLAADFIINQGGWASVTRMDGGFTSSTSFSDLDIRGDVQHARRSHPSGIHSPRQRRRQSDLSASAHTLASRNSTGNLSSLESVTLAAVRGMNRYSSLNHLDRPDRFTQSCRDLSSRSHHRHRASPHSLSRSSRDLRRTDLGVDLSRAGGESRGPALAGRSSSKEQEGEGLDVGDKGESHAVSSHILSSHTYDNLTRHRHPHPRDHHHHHHHHGHHRSSSQDSASLNKITHLSPEPHDSPTAQHLGSNNNNNSSAVPQNSSAGQPVTDTNSKKESSSGEGTQEASGGLITSQKLILSTAVLAAGMGMALILWKKGIS